MDFVTNALSFDAGFQAVIGVFVIAQWDNFKQAFTEPGLGQFGIFFLMSTYLLFQIVLLGVMSIPPQKNLIIKSKITKALTLLSSLGYLGIYSYFFLLYVRSGNWMYMMLGLIVTISAFAWVRFALIVLSNKFLLPELIAFTGGTVLAV